MVEVRQRLLWIAGRSWTRTTRRTRRRGRGGEDEEEEDEEDEARGGRRRKEATNIKSHTPHLAGGEKHVNTKTSQFSPFFDLHEFEKNMSTPKLGNVPHGSKFQSVNTKTSQFSQFFDLHEFEKNKPTPKVLEKTCQHQN